MINPECLSFITLPSRVSDLILSKTMSHKGFVIYTGLYLEEISPEKLFERIINVIDFFPETLVDDVMFNQVTPKRLVGTLAPTGIQRFPRTLEFNVTRMLDSSPEMFAGEIFFTVANNYFLSRHSLDDSITLAGKLEKEYLNKMIGEEYKEPFCQEFRLSRPVLRSQKALFLREQKKRIKK